MQKPRPDRRRKPRPQNVAPTEGDEAGRLALRSRRMRWLLLVAGVVAAMAAVGWLSLRHPGHDAAAAGSRSPARFVGSDACSHCHAAQFAAWKGSQHAHAMQHANAQTVRGDFDGAQFSYAGVQTTFSRRDGRYFVRTDGPDGKLADFEVKYTFGIEPLQQYLVELPGGRLQALSIAWDTRPKTAGGGRWFHLYPREKIDYRDELHWTKRQMNWNFMCADCHSVNVRKNYDATTNAYATTWSDLPVGCEACHGPGSAHVAWANKGRPASRSGMGLTVALDERYGASWTIDPVTGNAKRSAPRVGDREIEVCAQCHARRAQIGDGYVAGRPFLDYYLPALLTSPVFYADGQQRDEDYIWASFLQSRMYRDGVTCSDCHDPHTAKTRVQGDGVCAQCHAPTKYATRSHHHHDPASPGARCVNCHMPATTYMVVDPRRDHSFRTPLPDQTVALGVPNACNRCHSGENAQWAAQAVRRWYGHDPEGFQTFAPVFAAATEGAPGAATALARIADDSAQSAIARASALDRLAELSDPVALEAARRGARDPDALVRLAALRLADELPVEDRASLAVPLLSDSLRAVRIEAARVLAPAVAGSNTLAQDPAWKRAVDEFVAAQQYNADRPEARVALGTFDAALGQLDDAQAAFASARKLDPTFVPAYVNAADALRAAGRDDAAGDALKAGLASVPDSPALHYAMGLWHARQKQPAEALRELERATTLAPDEANYDYVYAIALNSYGRREEAIRALERAAQRWPRQRDVQVALVTIYRDAGQRVAARHAAQRLVQKFPDDPEGRALLRSLE